MTDLAEAPYPFQNHMGFRMVDWAEGRAVFDLPLAPELGNRYGIPHGGVYAVLLDTVMGYAGCFTGDPDRRILAMTLSMTVNFLAQPTGPRLIGTGTRTGGGRRTFFAEGRLTDEAGALIATGTGVFRYRGA